MKTFREFTSLLCLDEAEKKADEWTTPLHGAAINKHLGKSHIRGIVSDDDYQRFVRHQQHIPVFKVKHSGGGFRDIRVGNTNGDHFVEYKVNRTGTVHKKTVYARADGLHPDVRWSVHSTWNLEDEQAKKKGKK